MTGFEDRVHTAAVELLAAVNAADPDETRRVVDRHTESLDYLAAYLAARLLAARTLPPPAIPQDRYALRGRRVQQIREWQAAGAPPEVIAARVAAWHQPWHLPTPATQRARWKPPPACPSEAGAA